MVRTKIKVIGVTGGIGSGKSTVTKFIREKGYTVLDADSISHEMTAIGQKGYGEIVAYFGKGVLLTNGEIDRKKLGNIVFNDKDELKVLEKIITDKVVETIKNEIAKISCSTEEKYLDNALFLDVPLLFETGLDQDCDMVWLVDADIKIRIERVMKRDNVTENMVRERMFNQLKSEYKKELSDVIIDNSNDIDSLHENIERLLENVK